MSTKRVRDDTTAVVTTTTSANDPPSAEVLRQAALMSMIDEDGTPVPVYDRKDIHLDYWGPQPGMSIVMDEENKINVLAKSDMEFTSPIQRTKRVGGEIVVETENSIYIVLQSAVKVCKKQPSRSSSLPESSSKKKK